MRFAIFLRIFVINVESNIFSSPERKSQASAFLMAYLPFLTLLSICFSIHVKKLFQYILPTSQIALETNFIQTWHN